MDDSVAFLADGFENGGDQFWIGGQGDVFLRTTFDRVNGCIAVVADTAGDYR